MIIRAVSIVLAALFWFQRLLGLCITRTGGEILRLAPQTNNGKKTSYIFLLWQRFFGILAFISEFLFPKGIE
jgi:hypothetical protein